MDKKSYEDLVALYDELESNIYRISRAFKEAYREFQCDEFERYKYANVPLRIDKDEVLCEGDGPYVLGECDHYNAYYSKELLLMSDEQLKAFIQKRVDKHLKDAEKKKLRDNNKAVVARRKLYNELKKEFES